ncbi:MAG TPA: gliding motility-associated C-terminal domain-containing protein [Flavobacteriales bacterium]|nr:gliding motility-associated C-terminal domain-containing protein [Flavobacteriales bacterium]
MNRTKTQFRILLALLLAGMGSVVSAQTKYWTGGNGNWDDASRWSLVPGGPGGAGVPRVNEDVVIAANAPLSIAIRSTAWCKALTVDAANATVELTGPVIADLNIGGAWRLIGHVDWNARGPVHLVVRREGVEVDLRGRSIAGHIALDGNGSWSLLSDLSCAGDVRLRQGTLITNGNCVTARAMVAEGTRHKEVIAGSAVFMLRNDPDRNALRDIVRPASSVLVVNGSVRPWDIPRTVGVEEDRDINICGTGAGQTPFTVNAQLVTNFNGYGVRCRGNCNATVTATVTGGSGNFTYSWLNGGPPTATWTTACGGPQLVVVTDVVQGISCPAQVNVTEPAPIGIIFFGQGTPPSCADVCDGTRTALAIGGVSPHTYDWNNGAGTNSSFSNLCAGTNTLRITDANGCTKDTTFIFNLAPISPNLTFLPASCFGECSGEASVAPSGGTGTYTVLWTPAPGGGQGTFNASGLCAGNYSVNIRDVNSCDTTVTFTITEPAPIIPVLVTTNATCAGTCDGTATLTPSGAVGPYTFFWDPLPGGGQGTGAATGLCEGNYTVLVTDQASGCDTLVAVVIDAPPAIDVQGSLTDASCANTCDGEVILVVAGGTGPYTYFWSPTPPTGQGTASISGLCAGDWSVTVSDAAGCDTLVTFTINAPPPLAPDLVTEDVSCAGACDGTATVTVTGGVQPYTYAWSPTPAIGQGTPTVEDLCAGSYSLTVTDANGCDTVLAFTILEPLPLAAVPSQTNVTCGGLCDGTASVLISGGTPIYSYVWTPAPPIGQGTPDAAGLCAGAYSVLTTDANGCTLSTPFTILDAVPIQISLQLTPASCPDVCDGTAGVIVTGGVGPYAFDWDPAPGAGQGTSSATGLCAQAYSLTITDAVGCDSTISFTIVAPPPIVPNPTWTDVTCSGSCNGTIALAPTGGNGTYSYTWNPVPPSGQGAANAFALCAGDWQVTISSGGCDTTVTITIAAPPPIVASVVPTNATCAGACDGSAVVTASGGTPPLSYTWSPVPGSGQGTPSVDGLCPGPYSVTVSDAAGCDTVLTFNLLAPPPIVPGLSTTTETCSGPCTGTATVAPSGGTGTITAFWQPAPGGGQNTFNATGLCAGVTYSVTLTDANGCDSTQTFTILPSATIVANSSSTPVSCAGECDGTATVGPTGGTPPYTYLWSPPPTAGQGTPSASGLCAGTVQVTITDAELCSIVADILILGPLPISNVAVHTKPLCAGACDGTIVMNTFGGVPPFTYSWTPTPPFGQGTDSIAGLCSGTWNAVITDATGCSVPFSYVINEPPALDLSVTTTPSQCQVCIGTATATASGGTGFLGSEWRDALGNVVGNNATVTDLCAGLYTVIITDENGCTIQRSVPITDSNGEDLQTTNGTTTCANTCDGVVSVTFTCTDPPCLVAWADAAGIDLGEPGLSLDSLCPGDYLVSVTNGSGCVSIDTATVVAAVTAVLNISSTPVSCTALCDGTATVGIVGTPPFTFTWTPAPPIGQGTPTVSGLCAGVYDLVVGDGLGCETDAQVLITEPPPLSVFSAIVQNISCFGSCDGNITLLVTGGTEPLTYSWTPAPISGQGNPAAFGFCAGNVTVTVTDANGCSITETYVITEPQPLQITTSSTPSTCPNCDGTASVTVVGGTGPFTFSWTLGGGEISTDQAPTDLCGGIYVVNVRDAFGCTAQEVVEVFDSNAEVLDPVDGQSLCANACDGQVSVNFVCSVQPCTVQWTDASASVIAENVTVVTGLCAGTYTVQVTNAAGCVSLANATVTPSQTIVPNLSSTPVSCSGVCDGTATVGPIGGVEPYSFTWSPEPGSGQGTPQATGLCAGVYDLLIADATGCDTTISVLITGPQPLVQQALVTNASCAGSCNGSIVVTPGGGTGPYTFFWSPVPPNGQGSNGAFDLCAGTYDLTVTDANGCFVTNSWTVTEPAPLVVVGNSVASECGLCSGGTSVDVTGGTAPYTYLWTSNGNIFGTADSLDALCAGLYSILVTDSLGCQASLLVPVQDLNGELLATTGDTVSCPGICDGTAEVLFNCGTPACTIAWFDGAGNDLNQSGNQVSSLCAGNYIVIVTNGIGCLSIDTAIVASPDPIIANLSTAPETCFGSCDGVATVGPTGGLAPYDFVWSPAPPIGQGTPQAEGLCAGNYEVVITDFAGCSLPVSILILGPPLLTADVVVTAITCNGACDGSIVVTPQGGTGPYTYNWTPEPPNGPGSNAALELCPGDWTVQVVDANGCDTVYTITMVDPPLLDAELVTTNNQCFGDCSATADVTITGGVAPYTTTWRDAANTVIAQDTTAVDLLCAGDYVLSITDANGCLLDVPFTITEGTAIAAALVFTGETCFGPCDGTAGVTPTGGTGPYTFLWQPDPGAGQGSDQVTGLCAGNWAVTITDALGCDTTYAFTLLPYTAISDNATVTDVQCNGACDGTVITAASGGIGVLNYLWAPVPSNGQGTGSATGLCPEDLTLLITDAAGCDSLFTYTITEPLPLTVAADLITPASCADAADGAITTTAFGGTPPYDFNWSGPGGFISGQEDISGLLPGEYTVTVIDAHNCLVELPVTVDALVTVVANAGADQQVCLGTEFTLDGSASVGAVVYTWRDAQNNVVGNSPTVTLSVLAAGDLVFTLTVTDGPCSSTDQVTITSLALPIADAGPDRTIFLSETASLGGAPSGPAGSTFTWTPDSLLNDASAANPIADPGVTTWFMLSVVAPNGCTDTDSVLVTVVPTIVIPSGFTPNSDGSNDTWVIDFIDLFPDCEVQIFNRWGDQLFQSVGYQQPWTGKYRDGFVPVGTYYYVIELNDERFPEPYTGPLTVIR